jgi:hypothetical protein
MTPADFSEEQLDRVADEVLAQVASETKTELTAQSPSVIAVMGGGALASAMLGLMFGGLGATVGALVFAAFKEREAILKAVGKAVKTLSVPDRAALFATETSTQELVAEKYEVTVDAVRRRRCVVVKWLVKYTTDSARVQASGSVEIHRE